MAKMFKCQLCDNIPEVRQVFQCSNMHLMCVPCGLKNERVCKVSVTIIPKRIFY